MLALAPGSAPARPAPLATLVGGLLPIQDDTRARWFWSGAWRFPVGNPRNYREPEKPGSQGYRLLRSTAEKENGEAHQGVDLGCGHAGGPVRAAAAGVVVAARREGWNGGYGRYVVLGHRLTDGELVYSVYAHLAPGSVRVKAGQMVAAGTRLGSVGQSGRATTPHLHFEIRLAEDPSLRWEKERYVDPEAFVAYRLIPECAPDTLGGYFEWAHYAGLVDDRAGMTDALSRKAWWKMLAIASKVSLDTVATEGSRLGSSLIDVGLLPDDKLPAPDSKSPSWSELARDLKRLRGLGVRLPARPLATPAHRRLCQRELGLPRPADDLDQLGKRRSDEVSYADAVLALSDLAPAPPTPHRPKPRVKKAALARAAARRDTTGATLSSSP